QVHAAEPDADANPHGAAGIDQTLDRVRGCWIQKTEPNGRATMLLRLLPDREHPQWLSGQLQHADGDDPDRRLRVWLARDGRSALLASHAIDDPTAPAPKAGMSSTKSLVLKPQPRVEFERTPAPTGAPSGAPADTVNLDYRERGAGKRLRIEVSEEHLKLITAGGPPKLATTRPVVLFDGRRDGCD
ncbi:hypothetical protein, partial [Pseudomonas sp. CGJS7]|uniref:hypothetical protein n=1 Tax=Pseudomonas sp. CGJS7 TaxID=3109348 RepID=UPI00300BF504